jgi:hypothetical protein
MEPVTASSVSFASRLFYAISLSCTLMIIEYN